MQQPCSMYSFPVPAEQAADAPRLRALFELPILLGEIIQEPWIFILNSSNHMCETLEDMHISDAPSGQELDGAGCGSRSSCQKQVVFM